MYSVSFQIRSIQLLFKYPSLVLSRVRGLDVGERLLEERRKNWRAVQTEYSEIPKVTQGFKIYLNPADTSSVSTSIGVDGVLDLPLTCLIRKVLKKGMTFVDVGANLGYFTLLASKKVGENGKVYAFEPDSFNLGLLKKSSQANGTHNIEFRAEALVDSEKGAVKLFKAESSLPTAHSITTDHGRGYEEVPSTTLDKFWEELGHPSLNFIKIHVFGDDPQVLMGGRRLLEEASPKIVIAHYPPKWSNQDDLLTFLFEIYKVHEIIQSPFLLRQTDKASLLTSCTHKGLYLSPK